MTLISSPNVLLPDRTAMETLEHAGQRYDADLGISFIRMATGALRGGGSLFIVANRQLPYERELEALGLVWRKPVEDATFKLLFAEKRL